MASSSPKRPVTYEILNEVPDTKVGEIVFGELYVSPRPALPHASASSILGGLLTGPFWFGQGGPGGWIILDEPELHLSGDALIPDLAGWRRERLPRLPDVAALTVPPNWVCEVLSPSTEQLDRSKKLRAYARERVDHVWLIDPVVKTLEVLRLEQDAWRLLGVWANDERLRVEPFDAIELDLALLWAR